jgi:CheY-like chemotaxis protein
VLVVEDDAHLRHMLVHALRLEGFETLEANDGLSAILTMEWARVDAVVLDIILPGLDGSAVRKEMMGHGKTRAIPVVVVTGSDAPLDVEATCILRKPVLPDDVVRAVRDCIHQEGPPAVESDNKTDGA